MPAGPGRWVVGYRGGCTPTSTVRRPGRQNDGATQARCGRVVVAWLGRARGIRGGRLTDRPLRTQRRVEPWRSAVCCERPAGHRLIVPSAVASRYHLRSVAAGGVGGALAVAELVGPAGMAAANVMGRSTDSHRERLAVTDRPPGGARGHRQATGSGRSPSAGECVAGTPTGTRGSSPRRLIAPPDHRAAASQLPRPVGKAPPAKPAGLAAACRLHPPR
jgi:hypothetical protein